MRAGDVEMSSVVRTGKWSDGDEVRHWTLGFTME